jgi:hypothetical protein
MDDLISRAAAIDALRAMQTYKLFAGDDMLLIDREGAQTELMLLPSAQPEPLSDAYVKAVWTWLLNYQVKAAELNGRYTPYEVLSWVANDWRREHERSD